MLAILSPAKNMKLPERADVMATRPRYLPQTRALHTVLCGLAPYELESVMRTSPAIALRAAADFAAWEDTGGTPAALTFDGLAYKYLDAASFSADDFACAQERLRILSAFYGVLRPLDAIRPYRLELQHRPDGQSLYDFWGDRWYRDLYADTDTVVNLASSEYSRAVRPFLRSGDRFVTCEFLTYRKGKLRCLPAIAKMARGSMARYIVRHELESPEQLTFFGWNDFQYEQSLSSNDTFVFVSRA
ncbi:YaaA family protein [Agathobaculum sp.]|uniref:YaaA family protein n=1 Tax=Agathobaculum sp. TaxID=2048138 RepID=UPI002A81307A|nr:YaaA family protein [Agathobaculum sp.]MDY3618930.1 YaaA family protein [Agathobaculum sp.]